MATADEAALPGDVRRDYRCQYLASSSSLILLRIAMETKIKSVRTLCSIDRLTVTQALTVAIKKI